jgi:hypothetical protein
MLNLADVTKIITCSNKQQYTYTELFGLLDFKKPFTDRDVLKLTELLTALSVNNILQRYVLVGGVTYISITDVPDTCKYSDIVTVFRKM